MPVRKIPKSYIGVTGGFSSRKNGRMLGFESLLEHDYMIRLEFDPSVERFEEQPVRIPVQAKGRRSVPYVPDILIHFVKPSGGAKPKRPWLAEVKPERYFKKYKAKYAPKFAAAKLYAEEQGWEFHRVTEKEIRTPLLGNLKFLREYHNISPDPEEAARVLDALRSLRGKAEFNALLEKLCRSDDEKLLLIPVVWHLVAKGRIATDKDAALTDRSLLCLPRGTPR